MSRMRGRLQITYDGTDFHGWQRQPGDVRTVQSELEKALSKILNEPITVVASGRTDAGVHALAQELHFDTSKDLNNYQLAYALNGLLPEDISVRQAWIAPKAFHANLGPISKTYRYLVDPSPTRDPLQRHRTWWQPKPLSFEQLNAEASLLIGEYDFACFETQGSDPQTTIREIFSASWTQSEAGELAFQISGSGFLRMMVRNIVGHLVFRQREPARYPTIPDLIQSKNRDLCAQPAPACGLYLKVVKYPAELDNQCLKI